MELQLLLAVLLLYTAVSLFVFLFYKGDELFKPGRKDPQYLHDLLPWFRLAAPGIVQNKDGSYLMTLKYRGPDLDSSTKAELVTLASHVNNALRRLGGGWVMFAESRRIVAEPYRAGHFPNEIAQHCEAERVKRFQQEGTYFESEYYLTLQFLPPSEKTKRLEKFFIEDTQEHKSTDPQQDIRYFNDEVNKITDILANIWPDVRRCNDDELLTYLHSTISTKRHGVKSPDIPIYLDAILQDDHFVAGIRPLLGDKHIQCISVKGFPVSVIPMMLDGLNRLGVEYRFVNRFVFLDAMDAERQLKNAMKRWYSNAKSSLTYVKERLLDMESQLVDDDALDKGADAKLALQTLKKDIAAFGYYTFTVVVMDGNEAELTKKARLIEQVINTIGFTSHLETVNSVEAWLGTIPGIVKANVRKPILSTLQVARLIPTSAVWAGPAWNKHFNAPPLFQAITDGNTPFRYPLHVGDVGHTMLIGPTGTGKSTFLNFMAMQFLRYAGSRIVFFDVKKGSMVTTHLMGGRFYELANNEQSLRLQPLADINEDTNKTWAAEWIEYLIGQANVTVTPAYKREIWNSLTSLANGPRQHRTLTGFTFTVQTNAIRQAMAPYIEGGAYGHIFDGSDTAIQDNPWLSFEMADLLGSTHAAIPALSYLMHFIERKLDGRPCLIVFDEAWLLLSAIEEQIKRLIKTARSKNASIIFASQSLDDVATSPIFATINDNVLTRIFLPNSRAQDEATSRLYRACGLNARQLEILALATPKQDYYLTSENGNRLFQLGLDPLTLTVVGSNSTMDLKIMQEAVSNHEPQATKAFLMAKGHIEIANNLRAINKPCLSKYA